MTVIVRHIGVKRDKGNPSGLVLITARSAAVTATVVAAVRVQVISGALRPRITQC